MKKLFCVLISAVLIFPFASVYADEIVTVYINGNVLNADTPAVVVNGSTMLPFRAILNALGVSDDIILWDEKSQSIEVKVDGKYIFLVVDIPAAIVNNELIELNTSPYIINGRTMVPVRFISESLGAKVEWDENTNTVNITL